MHNNSGVKVILLQSIRHVTIMWKSISQRFCENLSIKSPYHRPCLTTFFLCFITKQHFWYRICLVHDVVTKPHLVPNHIKQHPVPNQTTLRKLHKGNCLLWRLYTVRACLVSKSGVSLFISFILYSNPKLENRKKKHLFSQLVVFGKLFWIHKLNLEYIILRFDHCFFF